MAILEPRIELGELLYVAWCSWDQLRVPDLGFPNPIPYPPPNTLICLSYAIVPVSGTAGVKWSHQRIRQPFETRLPKPKIGRRWSGLDLWVAFFEKKKLRSSSKLYNMIIKGFKTAKINSTNSRWSQPNGDNCAHDCICLCCQPIHRHTLVYIQNASDSQIACSEGPV